MAHLDLSTAPGSFALALWLLWELVALPLLSCLTMVGPAIWQGSGEPACLCVHVAS